MVPIYAQGQNVAILACRKSNDIIFEAFELSPQSESVVGTNGRLRRYFPDAAVAITLESYKAHGFHAFLVSTINKMSQRSVRKSTEAFSIEGETAGTAHPGIVTELLMTMLRACGKPTQTTGVWKNTRDDVFSMTGHRYPWRRSPIWLLFRTVLHLSFSRGQIVDGKADLYKGFMVYFMSRVLGEVLRTDVPDDMIYAITAKIDRRLLKLGSVKTNGWIHQVHDIMTQASQELRRRQEVIVNQEERQPPFFAINSVMLKQDMNFGAPQLSQFVESISQHCPQPAIEFEPQCQILHFPPQKLPQITSIATTGHFKLYNLAAFEEWVDLHLEAWISPHKKKIDTGSKLLALMKQYHEMGRETYKDHPESISNMILVLLELWIAIDTSAVACSSLLSKFSHRVSTDICTSLLLPLRRQMERLDRVEEYLKRRQSVSNWKESSLSHFGHPSSFAVKYFKQTPRLKLLKEEIAKDTKVHTSTKVQELADTQQTYRDLMAEVSNMSCEYTGSKTLRKHKPSCARCKLEKKAAGLKVKPFERPLPREEDQARAVVFEMKVPEAFAAWRDASLFFCEAVLLFKIETSTPRTKKNLTDRDILLSRYCSNSPGRITILSETKRAYRIKKPLLEMVSQDVIADSSMNWRYFDSEKNTFLSEFTGTLESLSEQCTFRMEPSSEALQQFLSRPLGRRDGPAPNSVISQQSKCPQHMSLQEFRALCSLPLGDKILWLNVETQLAMPHVDWRKKVTTLFMLHTAWQTGPMGGTWRRVAHEIVSDSRFVTAIFKELHASLERIRDNWEGSNALLIFAGIATRILSLGPEDAHEGAIDFLGECQQIASHWLRMLRGKALSATDDVQRATLLSRAREVALVGTATFCVDQAHLNSIMSEPKKMEALLVFSIMIQETELDASSDDMIIATLVMRWRVLMRRVQRALIDQLTRQESHCLDSAILHFWPTYMPCKKGDWILVGTSSWVKTNHLSSDDGLRSLPVHFNLFTAELRVNGAPLRGLPAEYESHPTYRILFGRSRLQVSPTSVNGMLLEANEEFENNKVYFGAIKSTDGSVNQHFPVRAELFSTMYDLVPPDLFIGLLPTRFIEDYVHWFDSSGRCVHFRPKNRVWEPMDNGWKLNSSGNTWSLRNSESKVLLSLTSTIARRLDEDFKPIEDLCGLNLIWNMREKVLNIEIPRLKLSFSMAENSDLVESCEFKGTHIDKKQIIGTLLGLDSKLVLKGNETDGERVVLIPDGAVSWEKNLTASTSNHPMVKIAHDARKVHAYQLETHLRRLKGNGSLKSKLFLAYLHALTSYCLPEPFTQHTGTEEALRIMRSEGVRSSGALSVEDNQTLLQIARLSPVRQKTVHDKGLAQSVNWTPNLSFLSQPSSFILEVEWLFNRSRQLQIFNGNSSDIPDLKIIDQDLLK